MSGRESDPPRPLARRDGGPVFDEPWQAHVLALAFALSERGVLTNAQWSQALGEALRRTEAAGAPDTPATYYQAALAALERLAADGGAVTAEALDERTEAWRRAYRDTPHGAPVELSASRKP